jgi:dihydrofolate synthase/folylpolyglutamate synthase
LTNSAIAIAALHVLREQGWQISDQVIQIGLAQARWPGRLQWLTWEASNGTPYPWLLDGAHNPAAAKVLRAYVDAITQPEPDPLTARALKQRGLPTPGPGPTTWLLGMLATKDHADVLRELLRPGDRLHLVPVPDHATMAPAALEDIALTVCPDLAGCQTYETLDEGLRGAIADPTQLRVLCGSLYLIGHFFQTQETRVIGG